jgi:hypothetical protein
VANTTIVIGSTVLPACSKYNEAQLPEYAEYVSMSGIVTRDRRTIEPTYQVTLGWEALTPAEKALVDAAWNTIINATPTTTFHFTGLTGTPYDVRTDEKSNDYTYTGYMGAVQGTGFTTLYDATLSFRIIRVFV